MKTGANNLRVVGALPSHREWKVSVVLGDLVDQKYTAVVTTTYSVHAPDATHATKDIKAVVQGGIFSDNVVIVSQSAEMYQPDNSTLSMSYFKIGAPQLG